MTVAPIEEVKPVEKEEVESAPPAEAQKSEAQVNMIPQGRLNEVIERAKTAEAKVEQMEAEKKKSVDDQLAKNAEWEKLATSRGEELNEAQAKAGQVDEYEKTLQGVLDSQIELIPEELRGLVPEELSVQKQLEWITKNKSLLNKPIASDIGAGVRGGEIVKGVDLTDAQKVAADNMKVSHEDYGKNLKKK